MLSLNSGNGTSPVEISYSYADEVTCTDPDDPSTCSEAGPPAQLGSLARGDITTEFTFDGVMPVAERSSIEPGSATGLRDSEHGITLNTKFQPQADRVTVGNDTFTSTYGYDVDGLLTCAAPGTTCNASTGIVYLFDGRAGDPTVSRHGLLEGTTAQTIAETFGYNSFGELTTHNVQANAATIISISYGARDPLGRILAQTTTRSSGGTSVGYTYDEKGQLLTVTPSGGPARTNVYDKNGNRLCTYAAPATDCDEVALYDAQDRLREFEGVTYSYTDRGSLYQRDDGATLETFTYDALGNLTQVARSGAETVDYIIDPQGRRVGRQVNGVLATQYVWSNGLRIAAELNGAGEVVARFIYGNGVNVPALIVQADSVNGDRVYRVITDQLGSPLYVVNVADPSDVLLDATYDQWGQVVSYTSSTGIWPIPFGFAGGLYDEDTGLVRFGVRDYDPRVGRWTAKDPIRWKGGQSNLYSYAGANPANLTDPTGLTVYACQEYNRDWSHYWWVWYGFSHAYLQTDTNSFGLYPGSPWPGGPGKIQDDSDDGGSSRSCREIPDVDEDCVNNYAWLGSDWGSYPFDNCGSFVADVLNACRNSSSSFLGQEGSAGDGSPPPYPPGGF